MTTSAISSILPSAGTQGAAAAGTATQSLSAWLASLESATSAASGDGSAAASPLSDQMQAMLTQLQGGQTVAPAGATPSAVGPNFDPAQSVTPHGHHHHHGHPAGTDDQGTGDLANSVAASLTGTDADEAGTTDGGATSGSFADTMKTMLSAVGGAAIKGAATGAVLAAL